MVLAEMEFECIVIDIVLRLATAVSPVADMAALMLVTAMCEELVVAVESFSAEATFGVTLETGLVDCAGVVVAVLFVFFEFFLGEKLMFVGKDFLVPRA